MPTPPSDTAVQTRGRKGADEAARAAVEHVLLALGKALRAQHLYDSSSPILERFVATVRERFGALWDVLPSATVVIEEDRILWEGEPAYRADSRTDPLIYPFFKDGVRELTFFPGFDADELDQLLAILARVHHLRADEDDLLTLLWEHDWNAFLYQYVDLPGDEMAVPTARDAAPAPVTPPAHEAPPVTPTVREQDFRDAPHFLDEAELRAVRVQLKAEMERDLWRAVLFALLDRLEDGSPERQGQVVALFDEVLPSLLGAGNLRHAALLLQELRQLLERPGVIAPAVHAALSQSFARLATGDSIDELIRTVDESPTADVQDALGLLLQQYPPDAIGPLIRAAETLPVPSVRSVVAGAVERLATASAAPVIRLLDVPDPLVAMGAARLAGRSGDPAAVMPLTRLLEHRDARVRLAAVESLQALGSAGFNGAVQDRLADADREVRIAAARALAALRFAPARARLLEAIRSGRLRDRDVTERIAYFEAFGAAAGHEGVPVLERILNGRSWLGRREAAELRACAALGLGRARSPAARKALQAALEDPDPIVRSAVTRAYRAAEQ